MPPPLLRTRTPTPTPPSSSLAGSGPTALPLRVPRRAMSGWALVRRGSSLRAPRRWVVLSSGTVCVYESPDSRQHTAVVVLNGASASTNPVKLECVLKGVDGTKIAFVWAAAADLMDFKAAFEFANRVIDDRYQTVGDRVLTKRADCEVIFGFDKATGEHCAIKVLSKDQRSRRTVAECEVAIRMSIDHRAIVRTVDVFETPFDLFLVMDFMSGGSLAARIKAQRINSDIPVITEHDAQVVMLRLFSALSYLHSRGIIHRNVKPENILYECPDDDRWPTSIRLSDFRKACYLYPEFAPSPSAAEYSNVIVGSPDYLAPEAAGMMTQPDGSRRPCLGPETDMWAAGVTLFNVLSQGALPFAGTTTPEVLRNAKRTPVSFDAHPAFHNVSAEGMSLIRALLNPDRRKRPSAESVLFHPWFNCFDSQSPGPGMRPPPLFGRHKFRAVATTLRFMIRLCANTPSPPKIVLSSRRPMQYANEAAPVDVFPAFVSTSQGVNIAPAPDMLAAYNANNSQHNNTLSFDSVRMRGVDIAGFHGRNIGEDLSPPAGVPFALNSPTEAPLQFTTSTLGPSDGSEPPSIRIDPPLNPHVLRTSQTSSLASFRSSYDDSRFAPPAAMHIPQPPSPRQILLKQQEETRQHLLLEQQHRQQQQHLQQQQHQLQLNQQYQAQQEAQAQAQAAQQGRSLMNAEQEHQQQQLQRQQLAAVQQQQAQQQLAQQQAIQAAQLTQIQNQLVQQQIAQQLQPQQPNSRGFIGSIMGVMRRDTDSPHTSNAGSRAHSNLAAMAGSPYATAMVPDYGSRTHSNLAAAASSPFGGVGGGAVIDTNFQDVSHRSQLRHFPIVTHTHDESMGSVNSSPSGSSRGKSLLPLEAGGVVHDPLGIMTIDGLDGNSRGGSRALSGMELADPLATDWSEFGNTAGDVVGSGPALAPHETALTSHETALRYTSSPIGGHGLLPQSPPGTGKKSKSGTVKKKLEDMRLAHFAGFFK